jgi:hypothetical protein
MDQQAPKKRDGYLRLEKENMAIWLIEINHKNKEQISAFVSLPFHIYRNNSVWVPPFEHDARKIFDQAHFPFYQHSEAAFFLAYRDPFPQPVGRIAVINPRIYNEFNNERTAFFYLYECEQDLEVSQALFETAFHWARGHGLNAISGPKGFTALNGAGLLVKGYEHRPAMGIPYNLPYYSKLIESVGFQPQFETVSGYLDHTIVFSERIHRASMILQKRRNLRIQTFRSRSELRPVIARMKDLYNGSLAGTSFNAPITDDEAKVMANEILWFANPRLIKIIMREDEPVGFLLAYPDISAAVQRNKGRMFPLGWADMLLELRRTPWININGAGILAEFRGLGGTAILFSEMYKSLAEAGQYRYADLVQIGTENQEMQREMRGFGIDFFKKHRVYQRGI